MHPAKIKAALAVAGFKQVELAHEIGVATNTVSAVINGRSRSSQIEQRIAEITGYTLAELWPAWHGAPTLVLTDEERALIEAYRALPVRMRAEWRAALLRQATAESVAPAAIIQQGPHSRAAGHDYHESSAAHDKPDDDG